MANSQFSDLPNDICDQIFTNLNHHHHHEFLSLTSKRFLTLTNCLRTTLTITNQTIPLLTALLHRFVNLKTIKIAQFYGDLDHLLHQISRYDLNIAELDFSNQKTVPVRGLIEFGSRFKCLKILKCSKLCYLQDSDLVVIVKSLFRLEEIDLSYPENDYASMYGLGFSKPSEGKVTDAGIEVLSIHLQHLVKIDISGNQFISDRSLFVLSSNCRLIREVVARDCCFVSQIGIGFLMQNSPNLVSVSVYGIEMIPCSSYSHSSFVIRDSIVKARVLSCIDFSYSNLSDDFFSAFAKACFPLKKLALSHCYNFTIFGISTVLLAYQSLTHLKLVSVDFLTDKNVIELSNFLSNLSYLNLNKCSKLTNLTLVTITKNCHSLMHVEMERTHLGIEEFYTDLAINPSITTLKVARNMHLSDEWVQKVVVACPNLQVLDASYCTNITSQGIITILEGCNEMRDLSLNHYGGDVKNTEKGFRESKLEVLRVEGSGIGDDRLTTIAKQCPRLVHLDLEGCLKVTMKGINEVLKNCRVLKELNLRNCDNVSVDCIALMVLSRPTLRRIIIPSKYVLTENQKSLFLRHGCIVCNT